MCVTDNRPAFSFEAWINALTNADMKAKHVAPYHTQADRCGKRRVRTAKKTIMKMTMSNGENWNK